MNSLLQRLLAGITGQGMGIDSGEMSEMDVQLPGQEEPEDPDFMLAQQVMNDPQPPPPPATELDPYQSQLGKDMISTTGPGVEGETETNIQYEPEVEVPEDKARSAYDQYMAHLKNGPQRQDPSWGRRIGAAIAGGLTALRDPKAGVAVSDEIINGRNRQADADFTREGEDLKNASVLEQKRDSDKIDMAKIQYEFDAKREQLKKDWAQIQINKQKADQDYERDLANATNDAERTEAYKKRTAAQAAVQSEANRIKAEALEVDRANSKVNERNASSRELATAAYAGDKMASLPSKIARGTNKKPGKGISPNSQDDAQLNAVDQAVAQNPRWSRHVIAQGKPGAGRIDMSSNPPPELISTVDKLKKAALNSARGIEDEEDDAVELPGGELVF